MKILKETNKPIQLQVALIPVCKMVMRFGLHFNEFVRNIQKAYIHAAEEIIRESKLQPNLQMVAIKTGMDRRTISEHKNNDSKSYTNPMNKMDMIIVQLQFNCSKKSDKTIHMSQLKRIIDSIYAQHIRSSAIIKELVINNILTKVNNYTYKLNVTLQQQSVKIGLMAEDVDFTAKRLFQTYYKNMFDHNSIKSNPLVQTTCLSSKIAPRHHDTVNKLLKKELIESEKRINDLLTRFESNLPDKTYPELGVTQFQFDSADI